MTTTGKDVRLETSKIAVFMEPSSKNRSSKAKGTPTIILFEWGTISFEGFIDSYSETIDFFSAEGIPLRATLSLSLTQQERTFSAQKNDKTAAGIADGPFSDSNVIADGFHR